MGQPPTTACVKKSVSVSVVLANPEKASAVRLGDAERVEVKCDEVIRPDAGPVAAGVPHERLRSKRTSRGLIRYAMNENATPADTDHAVSVSVFVAGPFPAAGVAVANDIPH
jgi:hypothetical protein